MTTDDPRTVFTRAEALLRAGREEEAEVLFEGLLAQRPEFSALRVDFALLMLRAGAKACAGTKVRVADQCEKALRRDTGLLGARQILGSLQRERGELEAAIATLLPGRRSGRAFADPQAHLALSLLALERRDELVDLPPAADPSERFVERVLCAIGSWCDGQPLSGLSPAPAAASRRNVLIFSTFRAILLALDAFRNARPEVYAGAAAPLHLLGDSHALSAAGLRVLWWGGTRRIDATLVYGCKAWHLLRAESNPYRANFEAALKRLPPGGEVLALFGDLDCRHEGGLLAQSRKSGGDPKMAARTLARDYVAYVIARCADAGHPPGFITPPASNFAPSWMSLEEHMAFVAVLAAFVDALRTAVAEAKRPLVDLYEVTLRLNGAARAEHYIDSNHLRPDPFLEAFENHKPRGVGHPSSIPGSP